MRVTGNWGYRELLFPFATSSRTVPLKLRSKHSLLALWSTHRNLAPEAPRVVYPAQEACATASHCLSSRLYQTTVSLSNTFLEQTQHLLWLLCIVCSKLYVTSPVYTHIHTYMTDQYQPNTSNDCSLDNTYSRRPNI